MNCEHVKQTADTFSVLVFFLAAASAVAGAAPAVQKQLVVNTSPFVGEWSVEQKPGQTWARRSK